MQQYDFVIIGSGFGGSVSALRLSEKGYKVLVIEKGKWFTKPTDFPKTNWNLCKWLWLPSFNFFGIQKLTFFRHVAVLSGAGVGGGSLVYANTLPIPKSGFFKGGSWASLADWESELKPFYALAKKMLGASTNPYQGRSDKATQVLARELGLEKNYGPTDVSVYFGKPGETVSDPYFEGQGPDRTGCILCGACMTGCRHNAKNTLDKNYLYLAQRAGCEIRAEQEVFDLLPIGKNGEDGYEVMLKESTKLFKKKSNVKTKAVIFAGGVLGTNSLLLKLKKNRLPHLSETLGYGLRTNSESLIAVTSYEDKSFSKNISIGSILNIDQNRHLEPTNFGEGSGFWRLFYAPMSFGSNVFIRLSKMLGDFMKNPIKNLQILFVNDWGKRSFTMLYMESLDSTLQFSRGIMGRLKTQMSNGPAPTAFNPMAEKLAHQMAKIVNGKPLASFTETLVGMPTTAHILGGVCMGKDASEGVIDSQNRVFNYANLWVCDGSMISANIGVNPSLSITAITERAMTFIPNKNDQNNI